MDKHLLSARVSLFDLHSICAGPIKNLSPALKKSVKRDIAIDGSRFERVADGSSVWSQLQGLVEPVVAPMVANLFQTYLKDDRVWAKIKDVMDELL